MPRILVFLVATILTLNTANVLSVEPNDLYYQPDSTNSNMHWVPDNMNYCAPYYNYATGRYCGNPYSWDDCCPDEYYYDDTCMVLLDCLHLSDQWYLQHIQANLAWDIEKGSQNIVIMIMDSGIDIEHPDLNNNIWINTNEELGDDNNNGLPGGYGDDDNPADGHPNFSDLSYESLDLDKDGNLLWGANDSCDAGSDGNYGFGPDAIDNDPPGPGGGDDDTSSVGYDPWDDNTRGPSSTNPALPFDDDFNDVQIIKYDDDENGYPDDVYGANFIDPISDYTPPEMACSDGLPGIKYWDDNAGGVDREYDGIHFNDEQVKIADFDNDGIPLYGTDFTCDAGLDGDYGFGTDAIDNYPPGPGGGDDDTVAVGYDPWDDNTRGPGSAYADSLSTFDDDMDDVYYLRYDNEEDGDPISFPTADGCPKTTASHGTDMAGIISAETNNTIGVAGVTWNCMLMPAKIAIGFPEAEWESIHPRLSEEYSCGDDNNLDLSRAINPIVNALRYAVDNNVDIINMSFTVDTCNANANQIIELNNSLTAAYEAGILLVASAGNIHEIEGNKYWGYPAIHQHVMSVSATNRHEQKASYATYNDSVCVCAPVSDNASETNSDRGTDCVVTTYKRLPHPIFLFAGEGPSTYGISGLKTSGAAAQVSGMAGLLMSMYPRSSYGGATSTYVNFIKDEIKRGAVAIDDTLYTQGYLGAGRINIYRSLTWWGDLDADTTWAGDIYVSTNYAINEGVTLTIAPGTTVHFATHNNDSIDVEDAKCALLVRGELIANGTSESPIVFKSMGDNAPAGSWTGIRLLGDYASATLNYCEIQDAEFGIKSHRTVNMNHCEVSNCNPCGVYLYEASSINESRLAHCTISDNDSIDAVGMRIWYCDEGDTTIVVDSCTVNNNDRYGIWVNNASPWIKHSDIKYNGEDGIYVSTYYSSPIITYPRMIWSRIQENGENGIYFDCVGGYVYATRISDNSAYGIYGYGEGCNALIRYSKIVDQMTGIRLLYAEPNLGDATDATSGHNTIDNSSYNVYHTPFFAEILKAENNYWASYPPNANKIKTNVDYFPALSSDPVVFLARMEKDSGTVIKLFQNYPNPVMRGNNTKISYYLPSREKIVMRIYDVSGRRIKTLVDDVQPQGMHYIDWNGKNERGNNVAPGIYFYRMVVGDKIQSKKIVIMK